MEVKKLNEFAPKVFDIVRQICNDVLAAKPGSIEFRSAIDELDDCSKVLLSQFDPDTVRDIEENTCNDNLCTLLEEAEPFLQ